MSAQFALEAHREKLGALIGLANLEVAALFDLIEDRSCWMLGPVEGSWVIRVPAGPSRAGEQITLYRLAPEVRLPVQRFGGAEECLVLAGALREDDGQWVRAGQLVRREEGARRSAVALGEDDCVCCVVSKPPAAQLRAAG